jgi:hypothetical protein
MSSDQDFQICRRGTATRMRMKIDSKGLTSKGTISLHFSLMGNCITLHNNSQNYSTSTKLFTRQTHFSFVPKLAMKPISLVVHIKVEGGEEYNSAHRSIPFHLLVDCVLVRDLRVLTPWLGPRQGAPTTSLLYDEKNAYFTCGSIIFCLFDVTCDISNNET